MFSLSDYCKKQLLWWFANDQLRCTSCQALGTEYFINMDTHTVDMHCNCTINRDFSNYVNVHYSDHHTNIYATTIPLNGNGYFVNINRLKTIDKPLELDKRLRYEHPTLENVCLHVGKCGRNSNK